MTTHFIDNPAAKSGFTEIEIDCAAVLKSWQKSVYSFEWLDQNGEIKPAADLSETEGRRRFDIEKSIKDGEKIEKPILGLGVMDNVEIGSGRAALLTLIDHGHTSLPVHVPNSQKDEFAAFLTQPSAKKETGSVLFYILIAVVLLGSLSFAITRSNRAEVSGMNKERARLLASEIITTSGFIAEAVSTLRLRGCPEEQISLEASGLTGHVNGSAPSDKSCHVFHINGGGLNFQPINPKAGNTPVWFFTGELEVDAIGRTNGTNTGNELIAQAKNLHQSVCESINKLNDISGTIPAQDLSTSDDWDGSYNYADIISPAALSGKRIGCFLNIDDEEYIFYRVLQSR